MAGGASSEIRGVGTLSPTPLTSGNQDESTANGHRFNQSYLGNEASTEAYKDEV